LANSARSFWPPRPPLLLLAGVIAIALVVMARSASVAHAAPAIAVSLLCACGALLFFAALCFRAKGVAVAAILCMLSSRAFVDSATLGLESALGYLLIAAWLYGYTKAPSAEGSRARSVAISLGLAALLFVNRADSLLLVVPAVGVQIFGLLRSEPPREWLSTLLVGAAPALAWLVFASFTSSSPVANEAWAAGADGSAARMQGFSHLVQAARGDPVTPLLIAMALVGTPLFCAVRSDWRLAPVALGVVLSLLYVVAIGGDVMLGSSLAASFFLSVMLLTLLDAPTWKKWRRLGSAFTVVVCIGLSLLSPLSPWRAAVAY
jgi:hypothetical protein